MGNQPIVIIADDVDASRATLASALEDVCTVRTVRDGREVLSQLEADPEVDLLLMDENLPPTNGFDTLAAIRAQLRFAQLPVLLCIESDDERKLKALDMGATSFFLKPYCVPEFIRHRVLNLLEKRRMEKQLLAQAQDEQIRQLLDSVQAGAGVCEFLGDDIRSLYGNPALHAMNGFYPEEVGAEPPLLSAMLPPALVREMCERIRKNLETGEPVELRYNFQPKRGKPQTRLMRALPMRYDASKNPVYLALVIDITRQSAAEEALHETSQRLQALLNAVPGGIIELEFHGEHARMTYFNDTLCNVLGYTRQEIAQRFTDNPIQLIHPSDRSVVTAANADFLRTGQRLNCRYRVFHHDGSVHWVRFSGMLISTKGDRVKLGGVIIDITNEIKNELATKQALAELRYRTEHDAFTSLYNRETFEEHAHDYLLAHTDESNVVMVADILHFKMFNELCGKEAGNKALLALSYCLTELVKDAGVCGRMDADRFVACLPASRLDTDALERATCEELKRQGVDYRLDLSFGLYRVHNLDVPVTRMCDRAFMAMKTVKGNVICHSAWYDDELRNRMMEEQTILEEMHSALENEEFVIYLQPLYSAASRRPTGAEVLVRWQHPKRGLLPPGLFIPLFEKNGFIMQLDSYVWERACRLLKRQVEAGHVLPLSINISRVDLYKPSLCEELCALVDKYGLDKSLLKLEITETAYVENPNQMLAICRNLHDHGFTILMDDFGSGYSSLNVLKDLPVDVLKMDMSFVRELDDSPRASTILTSVVHMAKWLHLAVVAEGVETENQVRFLHTVGCDTLQGYYFARPMSVEEYDKLLAHLDSMPEETLSLGMNGNDGAWLFQQKYLPALSEMVGCVGIFVWTGDRLELQRGSDQLLALLYRPSGEGGSCENLMDDLAADDRDKLQRLLLRCEASERVETAMLTMNGSEHARQETLLRCRFIERTDNGAEFCIALEKLSDLESIKP